MAGRIPDDVIENVKRAADIVDIVSRYVELKQRGRRFTALCPFHNEKTPSFTVHPERQFFKCFGCGKGGDVFSFVAEHERVDFPEAVRIVASLVGVAIPETRGGRDGPSREAKTRLYQLHAWAAAFFARCLAEEQGAKARTYLEDRHFRTDTLAAWKVGYAPDSWDALTRAARREGVADAELLAAGLVSRKEGTDHVYDRFRNRVVFPIADAQGRVIGFGARALGEDEVKYLNSPETPLFHKSRCLYGLDKARDAITEARRVVVTEGYTDTLMCHQHGITTAVATLGTALTADHARLLRRYADTGVLVFDADAAGQAAVDRSLEVFADTDLEVRVASTPSGTDPCELLVEQGPQAFLQRIEEATDLFDAKLDFAARQHGLDTASGRARAVDDVLASVARVSNPAKADLWVQRAARFLDVELSAVRRRLKQLARRRRPRRQQAAAPGPPPPLDRDEGGVLSAVLAASELMPCVLDRLPLEEVQDPRIRRILEACVDLFDREGEVDPAALAAHLQDRELAAVVAQILTEMPERGNWERWLQDCLDRLEQRRTRSRVRRLREQAAGSARDYDPETLAAIYEEHRRRAARSDPAAAPTEPGAAKERSSDGQT